MTTPTPTEYYDGLTKLKLNMDRFELFINGDSTTDVQTDNGVIPSLAKTLAGTGFGRRVLVPATATTAGRPGDFAANSSFIFVYTGNGTTHSWVRASAGAW